MMYVLSEVVQLSALFTMWVSLVMKMLNKRVSELKLEERSKHFLNEMRWKSSYMSDIPLGRTGTIW